MSRLTTCYSDGTVEEGLNNNVFVQIGSDVYGQITTIAAEITLRVWSNIDIAGFLN